MKRSPLNNVAHSGRSYGARHTPYNWKSYENTSGRGYQLAEGNNYQRFPVSVAGPQFCNDNFIPLNVSTPITRHEKYNAANRYSSAGGRGSQGGGWHNNYRGNYHATPRFNCSNRYPAHKHPPKQFYGHKRKGYKGVHRQVNVSAYVDINSFLEDPWKDLVKELNDTKDTSKSEEPGNESLSNSKLADSDSTERSRSKLSKDTNLDIAQCSQECKNKCSVDTSFETQNTDISQVLKVNSLVESDIGDICFCQDSLNESMCSVSDKICGATKEKNIHPSASLIDTDQKYV